ncbi:hypothetical protein FN846DRAFT_895907 [Sphaerosporella brunnea]|uniref:GPI anchored protein n=1 Tax=Sphaerosporella brunnea TaxID=1250544 RepID=A0A5J5EFK6_9PEZI|nr:hypothetical protein FN846DRAFT_895907 [Sphaerosporella brunnea]
MFFQKFILFLAFFGFALAQSAEDSVSTVTVKTDVFSTEYATVTMTGEPPKETATSTDAPVYSIFTSTEISGSGYPTASASSMVSGHPSATSPGSNSTLPTQTPSHIPSSGANSIQVSAGLAAALVAVYAAML